MEVASQVGPLVSDAFVSNTNAFLVDHVVEVRGLNEPIRNLNLGSSPPLHLHNTIHQGLSHQIQTSLLLQVPNFLRHDHLRGRRTGRRIK